MPNRILQESEYHISQPLLGKGIISAFSNRSFQNMSLFYADTALALENRRDFLGRLGIDYKDLACAKQSHGSGVRYAREDDRGKGALSYDTAIDQTDALVTDKKNLPLAIFTADCLSIFLYDPRNQAIGLVHAGWRGTREEIALKAVGLMQRSFDSRLSELRVGFGPAIRECCYEVGSEFKDLFACGLTERGGRIYLDLVGINRRQLLLQGVPEGNIFDSGACTSCLNQEFFSYRRQGAAAGRMISVIMLR